MIGILDRLVEWNGLLFTANPATLSAAVLQSDYGALYLETVSYLFGFFSFFKEK